jgi:hypothetical protein
MPIVATHLQTVPTVAETELARLMELCITVQYQPPALSPALCSTAGTVPAAQVPAAQVAVLSA